MRYATVLFDLDGTLLNTLDDLAVSINAALMQLGHPTRTVEEVRAFVGSGVRVLAERALPEGAQSDTETCLALFRAHYAQHMADKTAPYPGVVDLLKRLKKRGARIGVVSNKPEAAVRALCEKYFPGLVDAAVGDVQGRERKPSPEGTLEAMRRLKAKKSRTLYVGDSDVDVQTAHNAGLRCVCVTWGFRDRRTLVAAGADALADNTRKLFRLCLGGRRALRTVAALALAVGALHVLILFFRPALGPLPLDDRGGMAVPYLSQLDYPEAICVIGGAQRSVKTSGCGAVCVSMAARYLRGAEQSPEALFQWAYDNGYYFGDGLGHESLIAIAAQVGVKGVWIDNDAEAIGQALRDKHPVIAHMGPGTFTENGHYILLRGIDADGNVSVNDPNSLERSREVYPLSEILRQVKTDRAFMVCAPMGGEGL